MENLQLFFDKRFLLSYTIFKTYNNYSTWKGLTECLKVNFPTTKGKTGNIFRPIILNLSFMVNPPDHKNVSKFAT